MIVRNLPVRTQNSMDPMSTQNSMDPTQKLWADRGGRPDKDYTAWCVCCHDPAKTRKRCGIATTIFGVFISPLVWCWPCCWCDSEKEYEYQLLRQRRGYYYILPSGMPAPGTQPVLPAQQYSQRGTGVTNAAALSAPSCC